VTLDVNPALNDVTTPTPTTYVDMPEELARRIFTWWDDLNIPVPDDAAARPRMVMVDSNGNENAFPALPGVSAGTPLAAAVVGNYTWMATVTPVVDASDFNASGTPMHYIDEHRTYQVSVVVFYNRDFSLPTAPLNPDIPGERPARAYLYGGGFGGGDAQLVIPFQADLDLDGTDETISSEYLHLREDEWLMLASPGARPTFNWYRVVALGDTFQSKETLDGAGNRDGNFDTVGEDLDGDCRLDVDEDTNGNGVLDLGEDLDGDNHLDVDEDADGDGHLDCNEDIDGDGVDDDLWVREVTLAGPDIRGAGACACTPVAYATLCTGVIGVYTTTIELDDDPLWLQQN